MKTTDSVMREKWDIEKKFYEDLADNEWILDDPYSPDMVQMPFHELEKRVHALLSHSLAEARREERIDSYKKALDDMFLEICKLAEPDERQPSAGDLHTNMDDIHSIRTMLLTSFKKEVDLLTGDNPERKV